LCGKDPELDLHGPQRDTTPEDEVSDLLGALDVLPGVEAAPGTSIPERGDEPSGLPAAKRAGRDTGQPACNRYGEERLRLLRHGDLRSVFPPPSIATAEGPRKQPNRVAKYLEMRRFGAKEPQEATNSRTGLEY
jgi:hypothetical protein